MWVCARRLSIRVAVVLAVAAPATSASALDLVRHGKPTAVLIVPAHPLPVEAYAAKELQYHVWESTGAELAITQEDGKLPESVGRVYLGHCKATAEIGVDPSALPGNGYALKTAKGNLYLAGKDSSGDPLARDTHAGTLFGVYDLLENQLGVHWLWPGKLGTVIPKRTDISLPKFDSRVKPLLWFKEWRGGLTGGRAIAPDPATGDFALEQARWMRRQRFGRSVQPSYGHSFGAYWNRFSATHPEFFNMLPDGTRRPDPMSADMLPVGDWIHMCVSQPTLWKQVVEDWKSRGMPEFLNVCENDGWAACSCPQCLAWDAPDPDLPFQYDQRFARAKQAFENKNDEWMLLLGSFSDRYARFWKEVSESARQLRPDVKVVSYVYDNYRKPPVRPIQLSQNVLCGFVPWAPFPYNQQVSDKFESEWSGWSKTGCALFLRPNYTLDGHNFPLSYARYLGKDLKFAMLHSLRGTDFDSLTGQYSTQGTSLYMLAKILNHPDASVEGVIQEYCAAFGPARRTVEAFFDHWEAVTNKLANGDVDKIRKRKRDKYGREGFLLAGPVIYTPEAMKKGRELLDQAKQEAAGDATAAARVAWLADGLKQAELVLAAQRAYEHGIDTKDSSGFQKAYAALTEFRAQHATEGLGNFEALTERESRHWKLPSAPPN